MKLNPNVKIKQTDTEDDRLLEVAPDPSAGGGGLADIQAIEVGPIAEVTQKQADKFVDLKQTAPTSSRTSSPRQVAAGDHQGRQDDRARHRHRPRWRSATARTCSRRPACPPTATELARQVDRLGQVLEHGKEYKKKAPASAPGWTPSAASTRSDRPGRRSGYYDKSGKLIYETNPAVKEAWDTAVEAAEPV